MRRQYWIGFVLVVVTVAIYWPIRHYQFTNFDDNDYVTDNYHVRAGLTEEGVAWAFTSFLNSNWHPLTWVSHMLDCQLFGVNPAGHHMMNVGLHAANSVLLFALLCSLTGAAWRSALVAGLFAWHPMHVESVAWVAERKDVLSTFLGLLCLCAYVRSKKRVAEAHFTSSIPPSEGDSVPGAFTRPAPSVSSSGVNAQFQHRSYFGLSLFFFALALMSKPMMVTLPFVMLLLDYWPMQRTGNTGRAGKTERPESSWTQWGSLLLEKAPFFALSAASSIVTFIAQQRGGAVATLAALPLQQRLENVPVAYWKYVGKLFWPAHLCVMYPFSEPWPLPTIIVAALLLLGASAAVFLLARRCPYLAVGWFWFLATLIPVIGLVQVGWQSMADRYSYLPYVGPFIALVWGGAELFRSLKSQPWLAGLAGGAILGACLWLTHRQLACWHDSITLFERAVAVSSRNPVALSNLGSALISQGRLEEGTARLRQALTILPGFLGPRVDLASALSLQGRTGEAIAAYSEVLRRAPDLPIPLNNLAMLLATDWQATNRNGTEAVRVARRACELTGYARPVFLSTLAEAYAEAGQFDEAVRTSTSAIDAAARAGETDFKPEESRRLELYRKHQPFHDLLPAAKFECAEAAGLSDAGKQSEAMKHYRKALEMNPEQVEALNNLALILATDSAQTNRNGTEAVRLAARACELTHYKTPIYVGTLAEAYAEAGQFDQAVVTGNQAAALFDQAGDQALSKLTRQLVELFRSKRAYHEGM